MPTLKIHFTSPDAGTVSDAVQNIDITHLAFFHLSAQDLKSSKTTGPGLRILLPQNQSYNLNCESQQMLLLPGLVYVLSGSMETTIAPATHDEADDPHEDVSLIMVEISALISQGIPLQELLELPAVLESGIGEQVEQILQRLSSHRASLRLPGNDVDVLHHTLGALLVVLIMEAAADRRPGSGRTSGDDKLLRLKQLMARNLAVNLPTSEMALALGMSRATFYRWAKPLLGDSPANYMRNLRLQKCYDLLRSTALSIDQVAVRTGFSSRFHMTLEFKKRFKTTPGEVHRAAPQNAKDDLAAEVDARLGEHRFRKALSLCENGLQGDVPAESRDRLRFQQGRCLYALGRIDEAVTVWRSLHGGIWGYDAGRQLCSHYLRMEDYAQATLVFENLFNAASPSQHRGLIALWMHQVAQLINKRNTRPLPRLLELRSNLFPSDVKSMHITADALGGLGQENEVAEQCPQLPNYCFHSLRRAGLFDRAMAFEKHVGKAGVLKLFLRAGRYEDILKSAVDDPEMMVDALVKLGRAEEAIRRYPDHCQEAYLALRRYDEFLERWPRPPIRHLTVLKNLGRMDVARNYPESKDPTVAQYLTSITAPESIIASGPGPEPKIYYGLLSQRAVRLLNAGETDEAQSCLEKIHLVRSSTFWWWDRGASEVFLTTVVRGLIGQRDSMRADLEAIRDYHQYTDYQILWHDARFLLGEIDDDQFREQPAKDGLESHLALVKAIDFDLKGNTRQARPLYEKLLDPESTGSDVPENSARKEFILWRLKSLA
ncbi:MAG: helix-turn-helix domain-containing protein [Lentisphaeria bacterium]|nr:helix-turn-helix domain-containing protein [Lentisphaeria bacterium]